MKETNIESDYRISEKIVHRTVVSVPYSGIFEMKILKLNLL